MGQQTPSRVGFRSSFLFEHLESQVETSFPFEWLESWVCDHLSIVPIRSACIWKLRWCNPWGTTHVLRLSRPCLPSKVVVTCANTNTTKSNECPMGPILVDIFFLHCEALTPIAGHGGAPTRPRLSWVSWFHASSLLHIISRESQGSILVRSLNAIYPSCELRIKSRKCSKAQSNL